MKFLELPTLSQINSAISKIDCGNVLIEGRIEALTCTSEGADKKLYWSLEHQLAKSPHSPTEIDSSPFGPMCERQSRKTLIFLITALNHAFSDYDFTNVKPEDFRKEPISALVKNSIYQQLSRELRRNQDVNNSINALSIENFFHTLWQILESEAGLNETDCSIYSYLPDSESDPFTEEGNIWSFNYFFYNRKRKRVLLFHCHGVSKNTQKLRLSNFTESDDDMDYDDFDNESSKFYDPSFSIDL
eukprot:TRINITY_DN821_c0_g2_i2.p1 TRINITY_DN821_c0_g2~~TRINITY_DN821_c0_g2_i2.p1  ORF type:complete len:245 (-),score=94.14 TRINITY_DN821_c0_g2_i2:480-1214(-)